MLNLNTKNWHVYYNGQNYGPYTKEQLRELVKTGRLKPNYHVWTEGMTDWVKAEQIKGLFSISTTSASSGEKKAGKLLMVTAMLVGVLIVFGGAYFGLGLWAPSLLGESEDNGTNNVKEYEAKEVLLEPEENIPNDYRKDTTVNDINIIEEVEPDYELVKDALFIYMFDVLKHDNFYLLSKAELEDYGLDLFFDKYGDSLVYVYDFEKTGDNITVHMGEPFSDFLFSLVVEWNHEREKWVVKRYLD